MAKNRDGRYGLLRNTLWMIRQARESRFMAVPVLMALGAVLAAALNGINVVFAPEVLRCIEDGGTPVQLIRTVLQLAVPLVFITGLRRYMQCWTSHERDLVRVYICRCLNRHQAMTSYPNTEDAALLKKADTAAQSTMNSDMATDAIWDRWEKLLTDILCFALYLFLLRNTQPFLLLLITATTVAEHFINRRINEWGWRHRDEVSAYNQKMHYVTDRAENAALAKDIRIFGMRPWLEDIYRRTLRLYDAFMKKREGIYLWTNVIDVALTLLRNGFAYWWLLQAALRNGLPASEFLLYFGAATGFTQWIAGIMDEVTAMQKMSLELSTVREVFDMPESFRFEEGSEPSRPKDGRYELKMENVSFRYPGAQEDALKDISLTISPGEKLALVGLNGAGKTTLVKLLCGLYDPTRGRVLLNGKDIREFNRRSYYELFAAVFQQSGLMDGTVAENVAQIDEGYDRDRVSRCLKQAQLEDRVNELPNGMDTHLGNKVYEDAVELSGGETQRMLLARALYKNAPILLLDEPTAALDPIAESKVYDRYHEMSAGKTSVFISHRLASTRFCDRIIVLQEGRIAEEGTHEALLEAEGPYAELFRVQRQYYQEERENEEK